MSEVIEVSVILCLSAQRNKPDDPDRQKPGSQNRRSQDARLTGIASSIFVTASSHILKQTRLSLL